ncbi:hybrid sensor histidine kinase/response regulator [Rubrivivax sp. RP6-9]|uniref:hybrid sensor histidine kinase/response regulator n=1 Tax=Rubrivivax sp. RP6-9 TaxID=3415750 RepID=UPI003CC5219E
MRPLLDALPEPLLLLDLQGGLLHLNRAAAQWLGVAAPDMVGVAFHTLCADAPDVVAAALHQGARSTQFSPARLTLKRSAAEPCRCELARVAATDEHPAGLLIRLQPQAVAANRFLALNERIDALSREVARRRAVEAALREQGEWLHVVLRSIGDAVIATDAQARVVLMNPVAEQLCGWSEALARGQPVTEVFCIVHGQTRQPATNPVQRVLLERRIVGLDAQTLLLARDGRELPIDDAAGPILDADGALLGVVLVFREISERLQAEQARRALEQQLRNAQKMEAVGTLAGGIAHDFNNVLGAILANTVLAEEELASDHPVRPRLAHIGRAGQRARELVRQIMAFSRRQPQLLRRQVLQPLLEECTALLRSTLPASAQLRVVLCDEPLHVLADATQVEQVVMNLCTNAWHALRGSSGRIGVTLDVYEGDAPDGLAAGFGAWQPGRYARVIVSDNGCGMDAQTLQRVFEPFFTTKPKGEGTGLGLAVAHGIIAEHRGALTVHSTPGKGTRFGLLLPLVDASGGEALPLALPAPAQALGRGQHVVYIDDDEVLVATVEVLLTRAGFRVSAFASPRAALRALGTALADVDIVVSDFNMPELTGLEVAREVARMRPGLPLIVTSGYLSDDLRRGAHAAGVARLLNKEETYERLAALIVEVLVPR